MPVTRHRYGAQSRVSGNDHTVFVTEDQWRAMNRPSRLAMLAMMAIVGLAALLASGAVG